MYEKANLSCSVGLLDFLSSDCSKTCPLSLATSLLPSICHWSVHTSYCFLRALFHKFLTCTVTVAVSACSALSCFLSSTSLFYLCPPHRALQLFSANKPLFAVFSRWSELHIPMFSWHSTETSLTGLCKLYTIAPSGAYLATFDIAVIHYMTLRHLVPESAPGTCHSLASYPSVYGSTTGGIIMRFLYTIWVSSTHCSPIRLVPLFSCSLHFSENCWWRFNFAVLVHLLCQCFLKVSRSLHRTQRTC